MKNPIKKILLSCQTLLILTPGIGLIACGTPDAKTPPSKLPTASAPADSTTKASADATQLDATDETILRRNLLLKREELDRLNEEEARKEIQINSLNNNLLETQKEKALIIIPAIETIPAQGTASKDVIEKATTKAAADKLKVDEVMAVLAELSKIVEKIQGNIEVANKELGVITVKIAAAQDEINNLTLELSNLKTNAREKI